MLSTANAEQSVPVPQDGPSGGPYRTDPLACHPLSSARQAAQHLATAVVYKAHPPDVGALLRPDSACWCRTNLCASPPWRNGKAGLEEWPVAQQHLMPRTSLGSSQISPSCLVLWDASSLISPENVDRTVGEVRPTTFMLYPCPAWLIKEAQAGLQNCPILNWSFLSGIRPSSLKEAIICPLPKKSTLDLADMANFCPV